MKVVGWVLGALSLLNLIQDLGFASILGKLKTWLDSYTLFVRVVGNFLFGWIQFEWISISPLEHHALVLDAIICSAMFRAQYAHNKQGQVEVPLLDAIVTSLGFFFLFGFVPVLLIPDSNAWSYSAASSPLTLILFGFFRSDELDHETGMAPVKLIRKEIYGVLSVFLLLIALNYSIFHN